MWVECIGTLSKMVEGRVGTGRLGGGGAVPEPLLEALFIQLFPPSSKADLILLSHVLSEGAYLWYKHWLPSGRDHQIQDSVNIPFFFFLAAAGGLWNLSSLARD